MYKKIKSVVNKLCILVVAAVFCSMSAAVIAGSAVKDDDMKYTVEIVDADKEVLDIIPIGIGVRGDANTDGKVTVSDASHIARYLANISINKNYMPGFKGSLGEAMGDANADGKLTVSDAAKIARYLAKKFANPDLGWD
ncbi:MAG: hypothetical protein E7508_00750 [Ruminococcus sp.]|nr:hypothetical protein [Ruminococcus sp.]